MGVLAWESRCAFFVHFYMGEKNKLKQGHFVTLAYNLLSIIFLYSDIVYCFSNLKVTLCHLFVT